MCSLDPGFLQLVGMCLVPILQHKELEVLDVEEVAKKAVAIAVAVSREIEEIMKEGETHAS